MQNFFKFANILEDLIGSHANFYFKHKHLFKNFFDKTNALSDATFHHVKFSYTMWLKIFLIMHFDTELSK